MKPKSYCRFIRINGRLEASPRFNKKSDAEKWYHEMRRKKQFQRDGLIIEMKNDSTLFIDYAREWMKKRIQSYPMATWKGDEQRLRDYILPHFSELPISSITGPQVRTMLLKISEPGFLDGEPKDFSISPATRTRVKALLSAIFGDALNEDPPAVNFNPVLGIKFKEKRRGQKKPKHLSNSDQCLQFLDAAKEIGSTHYLIACLFLMSGLRKQELIALRWKSFDAKNHSLTVSEKYEQASNSIKLGTKAGEDSERTIPISSQLTLVLKESHKRSKHKGPSDFIVSRPDGEFFIARDINRMVDAIRTSSKLDVNVHGLRHTFGREFAGNTGNLKALQAILGHSSSATTDIYSELAGDRIKGFGEAVTYGNGVKQSTK